MIPNLINILKGMFKYCLFFYCVIGGSRSPIRYFACAKKRGENIPWKMPREDSEESPNRLGPSCELLRLELKKKDAQ